VTGDFPAGWAEHEWRWQCKGRPRLPSLPAPRWHGEALAGRTLLILAEQGIGDTIQFVRYVPLLAARGGRMMLSCPPELYRLMQGQKLPGLSQLTPVANPQSGYDLHCPLMGLPLCFGTTPGSIPAKVPYIAADPELTGQWRDRIASADARPRVGIAWAGNRAHTNDRNRSLPATYLSALAGVSGVVFHSLQKSQSPGTVETPPALALQDNTATLADMADTAALIANLDLVISVDTAVAHLAGAMGKPVWLLLPFAPDWRWFLARPDSPWYPTMRLFRQPKRGIGGA